MKIKVEGIADIERQNLVPLLGHFVRHARQITYRIADVLQTLGSSNFANLGGWHQDSGRAKWMATQLRSLTANPIVRHQLSVSNYRKSSASV